MFKKLLFFCLCFLVMNIANAEIQQFTNSFDNTMHIYVISEKTKSQFPRFFVFRKIISPESTKYYLSIQNNNIMSKYFSNIENIKLMMSNFMFPQLKFHHSLTVLIKLRFYLTIL